jgi:hypothetical protein
MTSVSYFQRVHLPAHENAHAASEEEGEAGEDKKPYVRAASSKTAMTDLFLRARFAA